MTTSDVQKTDPTFSEAIMTQDISEIELAFANLFQLVIGAAVLADPSRRSGFDKILKQIRDDFQSKGRKTGTAVIEGVRLRSTDAVSGAHTKLTASTS